MTREPAHYRQSHKTFFQNYRPEAGKWYRLRLRQDRDSITWELAEREGGRVAVADRCLTYYDGNFIALGTLRAQASFDNVTLKPVGAD